jgi:hypothetical protein
MDLRFKTNLLEHTLRITEWAKRHGASAQIDATNYMLHVQLGDRQVSFFPQFISRPSPGFMTYVPEPDIRSAGFVGWTPYQQRVWNIAGSKVTFKKLASGLGLRVPALWERVEEVNAPYLVKRSRSAFGHGMRGPYRAEAAPNLRLQEGEFCEEFKFGRIARAWYWSGQLAVLEAFEMPTLVGDGISTYEQLLMRRAPEISPHPVEPLAALQGVRLADVPPEGMTIVCDYRYVSPLNPTVYGNANLLRWPERRPFVQKFEEAGRLIFPHAELPPDQDQVGFVLDAIIDADDEVWFLELNSNSQGHPDLYATMLDRLFGIAAG